MNPTLNIIEIEIKWYSPTNPANKYYKMENGKRIQITFKEAYNLIHGMEEITGKHTYSESYYKLCKKN